MKILIKISMIILIAAIAAGDLYGQYILRNDKKNNGTIKNAGKIVVRTPGTIVGMPDTIGGKVEFISDRVGMSQVVPNVTYFNLYIEGRTRKFVDSLPGIPALFNPLRTLDSLIVDSTTYVITNNVEINAKAAVKNNTHISGLKDVRLNGDTSSQTVEGRGKFSLLNIDNIDGVDVVNNGGFAVTRRLTLTRGELRNSQDNNFYMADSSLIVRHVGGALAYAPVFDKRVSVRYEGAGSIIAGPEIPVDSTVLKDLWVYNSGGIYLSSDVTVNDTLSLASNINTEVTAEKHTLTLTSAINPEFVYKNAEIDGRFRRTNLGSPGDTVRFNNYYTWALFTDSTAQDGVAELTFRVKPQTLPPFLQPGEMKVYRYIQISARDEFYNPVTQGLDMRLGYGWRHINSDTARDETKTLRQKFEELILQRWTGSEWFDIKSSIPEIDAEEGWAYAWAFGFAENISATGDFAIGLPGGSKMTLQARVFLEGPYRCGEMAVDLAQSGMLSTTPPNIYPYNLDPFRQFISVESVPDSVVDWLLLEFRKLPAGTERYYKTVFLRYDGKLVDLDGVSPVTFSPSDIQTGDYYIVVKHRNHLAIMTEQPVKMYPENLVNYSLDLTEPGNLMGRRSSVKEIGFDVQGSILFGMMAGYDINDNYEIDDEDLDAFLQSRGRRGYEYYDIDMNGIVTTKDLNMPWNNRGEKSNVPK